MTPEELENPDPYEALAFVLKTYLASGNLAGVVAVSREMLPYSRPRLASTTPNTPLPADMEPDSPPTPDEPGPERIVG
jgi:hypothetical protein